MSGMLHPVGPEPARTYWIRRGVLLAVALLMALMVVFAVAGLTKAAVATAPPPAIPPVATSPTPSETARTPASTSAATSAATPGAASPSAATPSDATPSDATPSDATPSDASPSDASPSAAASTVPPPVAGRSTSAAPTAAAPRTQPSTPPAAKPSPTTTTVGTPDCRPAELRVTLKGDRTLSPGQKNRFTLRLINEGRQTCLASVTDKNLELKVYSGKDRIWSSQDCRTTLEDFDKKLAAGADVDWTMTWHGERSVKGATCTKGDETPRAGTYWATAQLKGADPVQLRMIIS